MPNRPHSWHCFLSGTGLTFEIDLRTPLNYLVSDPIYPHLTSFQSPIWKGLRNGHGEVVAVARLGAVWHVAVALDRSTATSHAARCWAQMTWDDLGWTHVFDPKNAKTLDFRCVSCVFPWFPYIWMNINLQAIQGCSQGYRGFVPQPWKPTRMRIWCEVLSNYQGAWILQSPLDMDLTKRWRHGSNLADGCWRFGWPTCESFHECFSLSTGPCSYQLWDIWVLLPYHPFWTCLSCINLDFGFRVVCLRWIINQPIKFSWNWRPKGRSKAASARLQREAKSLDKENEIFLCHYKSSRIWMDCAGVR